MESKNYKMVSVRKGGKTYKRKQPLHHKINKSTLKRELKRLDEEKEVIDENIQKAKERAAGEGM